MSAVAPRKPTAASCARPTTAGLQRLNSADRRRGTSKHPIPTTWGRAPSIRSGAAQALLGHDDGMPVIVDADHVREIDVVAVDLERDGDWSRWRTVPGEVIGTWTGQQAQVVLDLVAALPEAEQMRCFIPRFALRLRSEAVVLAEVAFCFQCHNALGISSRYSPKTPAWFTFDPDSEPAQDLLRRFRALDHPTGAGGE